MAFDFSQYLEEYPVAPFYAATQKYNYPFRSWLENQYSNTYGGYQGELAKMIQGGQQPTLSWTKYLESQPWMKEWSSMSPGSKGERPTVFNPQRRWMVY